MTGGWAGARNVLCVRLDSMGDVLMTTPAIRALKETSPDRRITLLTSPAGAAAARLVPEIDSLIEFQAPWMKASHSNPGADVSLVRRLEAGRFDAAVVFTVYSQSALPAAYVCFLAQIPLRLAHCRENPYQLLSDWVKEPEPDRVLRHEVRRQLDLVAAVGCATRTEQLSFAVPARSIDRIGRTLARLHLEAGKPLVIAHPGASAPSRRYEPRQFARAMDLLKERIDCELVFTGDPSESELVEELRAAMHCGSHSLAGRLTLEEFGALLSRADLLVSNNTGPVHVSAAVGTPVVDLYALTNPQHTPWNVEHRVLFHDVPCRYCYKSVCPSGHHDCLRLVTPEEVALAAEELLLGAQAISERSLAC